LFHFGSTNCLIVLAGKDDKPFTIALSFGFLVDKKETTDFISCLHKRFSSVRNAGNGVLDGKIGKTFSLLKLSPAAFPIHADGVEVIKVYYYMALACGRYNARSDWLIVTEL